MGRTVRRDPPIDQIYRRLQQKFGAVQTPLKYGSDYELAIAVILSAQCTDAQVNRVTPALFKKYTGPAAFLDAPTGELEKMIFTTGFYKNKAKNIRGFCRVLIETHGGEVPQTMEELLKMPGVGRKTANVILQELFGIVGGIVVDTHVARISKVLKLTNQKDPVKIEKDLMKTIPKKYWLNWSLYMIFLGRSSCTARKRICETCVLSDLCPSSSA